MSYIGSELTATRAKPCAERPGMLRVSRVQNQEKEKPKNIMKEETKYFVKLVGSPDHEFDTIREERLYHYTSLIDPLITLLEMILEYSPSE
ncbi:hypothetical protein AVEN_238701-1 [Araneus ventricosus]|uniref:Uncharacterized protein n=1 Tax=Araneus ventricosus TaxID=182803 RepID=A0A4Y2BVX3_ARAVE|nr:hypothetical protein AVEN_238701-1 [Araneus ventricosus]